MYDCDVFVRLVPLPVGAHALVLSNDDLTYDVYINSNICQEKQQEALDHELKHIDRNHLWSDLPIRRLEAEADGL